MRLQWRDRAGIAPASIFTGEKPELVHSYIVLWQQEKRKQEFFSFFGTKCALTE